MKIIGIEDQEEKKKQLNRKKIVISVIVSVIILIILLLLSLYIANKPFRDFMDKYVLMKNVLEDNSVSISIDENETNYIYAFNKYITVLNNNTLKGYSSSGKQEFELKVEIANPMFDQNNRFLLIAEKDKKKTDSAMSMPDSGCDMIKVCPTRQLLIRPFCVSCRSR